MKENIEITKLDYARLRSIISLGYNSKATEQKHISFLRNEIERAKQVSSKEISPDRITMNSIIEIIDLGTNKSNTIKLVYPRDADFRQGNISVLSPIGSALLGYKVGATISIEIPKGIKKIKICDILFQPEANGEYSI